MPVLKPGRVPEVAAVAMCLAVYFGVLLVNLAEVPPLNPDEAGYTAAGWSLLTTGRFGVPMYAGILGMSERLMNGTPGFGVLAVIPYALFGIDLFGLRLMSGLLGALLLTGVWRLARMTAPQDRAVPPATVAALALLLAWTQPVLFGISRFARPEVAVAAFAVGSSVLAARAWRSGSRAHWHIAAGIAAGLAFEMHYIAVAGVAALSLGYLLAAEFDLRRLLRPLALLWAGAACAALPWLLWVATDPAEFLRQVQAQATFQASRFPGSNPASNVVNELLGRYLLSKRDQPLGWSAWGELASRAGTVVNAAIEVRQPTVLVLLDPVRWLWLALLAAALVSGARALLQRRFHEPLVQWVMLPLLVWAGWLSLNPDKFENYAGTVFAYLAVAVAVLSARAVRLPLIGTLPPKALWYAQPSTVKTALAGLAVTVLFSLLGNTGHLLTPTPPYRQVAVQLHALVPPDVPVAGIVEEWFAFANRNRFLALDFHSLPGYGRSLLTFVQEQQPEYLALRRHRGTPGQRYAWTPPRDTAFLSWVDTDTALLGVVEDPFFGAIEVRRVERWPAP